MSTIRNLMNYAALTELLLGIWHCSRWLVCIAQKSTEYYKISENSVEGITISTMNVKFFSLFFRMYVVLFGLM